MMVRKLDGWLAAKVGGELVMMNAQKGNYIGLSEVGARVWELMDSTQDFEAICAELDREFDVVPEICRAEVKAFLEDLVEHGAVAIDRA
ncbi:PqqD family protein [Rhizomicrobium electricum]|uniref:PqqD family protein n=1 Tax=Rhizomicrobium electricum TaxID=480070 RepID=A0ABP3PJA9_9PROT|nr:PqqD family protein [Rhizomicrobium electricum]NIJ48650.1 hypothetical protein [Rhizomicrobium electricum]